MVNFYQKILGYKRNSMITILLKTGIFFIYTCQLMSIAFVGKYFQSTFTSGRSFVKLEELLIRRSFASLPSGISELSNLSNDSI